jgi:hypothetical protein
MESQTDQVVFEKSVDTSADVPLFQDKNYTYITDSTSNSGTFTSGQIQFDLSTFSSQSQWVNLSETVIQIPYKITGNLTTAGDTSGANTTTNTQMGYLAATFKNGFHHIIDSAQLVINGQTIQSAQPYENISAQFKILSSFSQDTLQKWGSTIGFALDDCTGSTQLNVTTLDNKSEIITTFDGLSNASSSLLLHNAKGFDIVSEVSQNRALNLGFAKRCRMFNNAKNGTSLADHILGTNLQSSGMSNVGVDINGNTANEANKGFSLFAMATIRLKDICSVENLPPCKNLKGYLYLSFNSFKVDITNTSIDKGTISSVQYTPLTGRTCPFTIMDSGSGTNQPGLSIGSSTGTTKPVVSFTGTVDGTATGAVQTSAPISSNARMLCPYYIANPKVDEALSLTKQFSTYEKIVNPINVSKGQTVSATISVGVPNPRRLLLVPFYQNLSPIVTTDGPDKGLPVLKTLTNPEYSAFDTVPATSSPFAYIKNLQVYLANKPIYQYPMEYGFEQWIAENSHLGLNGNADDELTSGLLSQHLWEQNHRFYSVDLSRRLSSEDGTSKSVQVSFTNGSGIYDMKVIAIVYYEKKWTINTSQCMISSA